MRQIEEVEITNSVDSAAEKYHRDGYAIFRIFRDDQVDILEKFARKWIYSLLSKWTDGKEEKFPLETYHIWSESLSIDHGNIFRAQNRHTTPGETISQILLNNHLKDFIKHIGYHDYKFWDEGLGMLAFRFIRPGRGDGYTMTRKEWGIAKKVMSCWIPIIGYTSKETIALVPGSHLKEYEKYLPADSKFRKDEYRLAEKYNDLKLYRPNLKRGEVILYHPKTLHSEDVKESNITRLNLEFRIDPAE
jgi:hypothetical protein